ncbi:MAG: YbaN family protein [Desulfopila sp.]
MDSNRRKNIPVILTSSTLLKPFLKIAAFMALLLGMIGAFVPVLPTTPFLILAAALSYNSSPKLRRWLLEHPVFGATIQDYLQKRSISRTALRKALTMLWLCMLVSILLVQNLWITLFLITIGGMVTIYLLRLHRNEQG